MRHDTDRTIAVLAKAVGVCRGVLYSVRTGDATQSEIEGILEATGQASLTALIGEENMVSVMRLSEALPGNDADILLGIRDRPADDLAVE